MEQNIEPNYFDVFIQWVIFFGLIGACTLPAILFADLARQHNKKGWIYLIIGLCVGIVLMAIIRFVMQFLQAQGAIDGTQTYLIVLFIALPVLGTLAAFRVLKSSFRGQRRS